MTSVNWYKKLKASTYMGQLQISGLRFLHFYHSNNTYLLKVFSSSHILKYLYIQYLLETWQILLHMMLNVDLVERHEDLLYLVHYVICVYVVIWSRCGSAILKRCEIFMFLCEVQNSSFGNLKTEFFRNSRTIFWFKLVSPGYMLIHQEGLQPESAAQWSGYWFRWQIQQQKVSLKPFYLINILAFWLYAKLYYALKLYAKMVIHLS